MKKIIKGNTYDEERALYNLQNATVDSCTFAGPADGESAFKEAKDIEVVNCEFHLRYPLWHTERFALRDCTMDINTRAPLWYSSQGIIENCELHGVKCLRECTDIEVRNSDIISPEFGWRCSNLDFTNSVAEGEYIFFESKSGRFTDFKLKGKYSFQYVEDMVFENCVLDTKDAFWHAKNVTCRNCIIKGEYLGWYSDALTLIDCKLSGTQPLCYCKRLKLVNCEMENADLSFEYSEVDAEIKGGIMSVKNPAKGRIIADSYGEIITENSVMELSCEIFTR